MNNKVIICNTINLDRNYKNVLNYTEAQMVTLVNSKKIADSSNYNFVKAGRNEIEVAFTYEQCLKANYMAFQNPSYSNKWFFAFIDEVEFRNPSTTRIRYTIDVFATWFDYWDAKACFVEREHVADDTIGLHTIDEGLDFGEYIVNGMGSIGSTYFNYLKMHVCIGVSWIPDNTPSMYLANRLLGNVFSGTYYFVFRTTGDAAKFVRAYAQLGHVNDIQCLYMIPEVLAAINESTAWNVGNLGDETGIDFITLHGTTGVINIDTNITISMQTTLNGYTPKNNKLKVYPYNCLTITNNCGTMAEYKYEDFTSNSPVFALVGLQSPSCPMYLYPKNYKKDTTNYSGFAWGIPLAKIPQGSWNADMYINWMTQNGVNILGMKIDAPTSHAIMGSLQALAGAGTMGLSPLNSTSNIMSGFGEMLGATQEKYRASMIPNQIGGQTTIGDITFAYDKLAPTYYKMSIRAEYARVIDEWLTRFGYKINRIKIPNQISRTYWNFVKIGASEIIGYPNSKNFGIPKNDMEIINNIYRAGVTIWHNHDNIGNYALDNTIASS